MSTSSERQHNPTNPNGRRVETRVLRTDAHGGEVVVYHIPGAPPSQKHRDRCPLDAVVEVSYIESVEGAYVLHGVDGEFRTIPDAAVVWRNWIWIDDA